jgi:hypothetical protein
VADGGWPLWEPGSHTACFKRAFAYHVIDTHAEGSLAIEETNRWIQLPGVGHTGASDKNIRARPRARAQVCRLSSVDERREGPRGKRVDREGHLITLYRGALSHPVPSCAEGMRLAGEECCGDGNNYLCVDPRPNRSPVLLALSMPVPMRMLQALLGNVKISPCKEGHYCLSTHNRLTLALAGHGPRGGRRGEDPITICRAKNGCEAAGRSRLVTQIETVIPAAGPAK